MSEENISYLGIALFIFMMIVGLVIMVNGFNYLEEISVETPKKVCVEGEHQNRTIPAHSKPNYAMGKYAYSIRTYVPEKNVTEWVCIKWEYK